MYMHGTNVYIYGLYQKQNNFNTCHSDIMLTCMCMSVLPGPIIMTCPEEGKHNVPLFIHTDNKCF